MREKTSVAMATCNGSLYVKEQVASILSQLGLNDELIIADDASVDSTVKVIQSIDDPRIKLYRVSFNSWVKNFEFALTKCSGNYIFLADQDDVWAPGKLSIMKGHLRANDFVVSNAMVTNKEGLQLFPLYKNPASFMNSQNLLWKLFKSPTPGCCMAFKRELLDYILPIPENMYMHDRWIWAMGCIYRKPVVIDEMLLYYRRHGKNVTCVNGNDPVLYQKSQISIKEKIRIRWVLAVGIMFRVCKLFFKPPPSN